jgi:hypothetical protein
MRLLLTIALCCGLTIPANAQVKPPASFYERAEELARWIDEKSDYGPMQKHPIYLFLHQDELDYVFFETTAVGYSGSEQSQAVALYFKGIVLLSDEFQVGVHDDVLLHELVHHLQAEQNRAYACVRAGERDAYALQTKFIQETGIGKLPDPMWAFLATRCEDF